MNDLRNLFERLAATHGPHMASSLSRPWRRESMPEGTHQIVAIPQMSEDEMHQWLMQARLVEEQILASEYRSHPIVGVMLMWLRLHGRAIFEEYVTVRTVNAAVEAVKAARQRVRMTASDGLRLTRNDPGGVTTVLELRGQFELVVEGGNPNSLNEELYRVFEALSKAPPPAREIPVDMVAGTGVHIQAEE